MALQTLVIEGLDELERALDPDRWWEAIERHAPRAVLPVAASLRGTAPRRTGRLANAGFDVRGRRIDQGLVQGVEVAIGAREPYGHLPERGFQQIPRGPSRKGKTLSRADRAVLRSGLKARRAAGSLGRVPGQFFAAEALEREALAVIGRLEKLLELEFGR